MKKRIWFLIGIIVLAGMMMGQVEKIPGPAFTEVLGLKSVGSPVISPCGKMILFTVRQPDWENNRYDTEIWLCRKGEKPFQLTRTKDGSSFGAAWSPDGKWISFLSSRDKKQQLYFISPLGGEAFKFTEHEEGINSYRWSSDGRLIAFTAAEPKDKKAEAREKQYGRFSVEDKEFRISHLWVIKADPDVKAEPKRLTEGKGFTVGSYSWSPDGKFIAFDHRPDQLSDSYTRMDISLLNLDTREKTPLVSQDGSDSGPRWSPDGKWILFFTKMGDARYYTNTEMARIPAAGGRITVLTESFDENLSFVKWTDAGILCLAGQKVFRQIFLLDPDKQKVSKIADTPENIYGISLAKDNNSIALYGFDRTSLPEIYRTTLDAYAPEKVTDMTSQVKEWNLGTREVIEWKSKDGAKIEGVLWKPPGFNRSKKYPLLISIHGGPTGTSRPVLVSRGVYPYIQWLTKGALILQPNYRGSAGYGEKFRSLNVRNLGVGDMWDVESGVDYLIKQGFIDPHRVGSMGWSQGGYISAFLTTNSEKFSAISVGAGISNWVTYYVNTDIHPFTRHYLKATPWEDMKVYMKTSPMTNINKARTPTLIQHGEFDRRVPIPNAYELYQGLQDQGVAVKLIVYKDFGHGISRPKEQLAAMWHNWQWFAKYIWNEEIDIPVEIDKK